ncbi:MAG: glycosyltransferase [Akkermansia sp.]|nr:glycosyltransferase [Akkermansia sp.]
MNTPLITVIIPVYNAAQYLRPCLDSLCAQTLREIEIICVNDGSTDASAAILRECAARDARVVVLEQENAGQGAARNRGLEHARGEYVAVVDSDDFVSPNFLEALYRAAAAHGADVACTADVRLCMPDGSERSKWMGFSPHTGLLTQQERESAVLASGVACNKLYRRAFLQEQGLRYFARKAIGEDNMLVFFSMMLANKVACVPDATYYYVQRADSSVHTLTAEWVLPIVDVYRAILDRCAACPGAERLRRVALQRAAVDVGGLLGRARAGLRRELLEKAQRQLPELADAAQLAPYRHLQDSGRRVLVTLTTYPARTGTVAQTVHTLLNQTLCPDAVLLWLAEEQYPGREADLPEELLALRAHGLEIKWTRDMRSFKKLIPALREYPEDILVTADDDLLYPQDWLEPLVKAHCKGPDVVCSRRCHGIRLAGGAFAPYGSWQFEIGKTKARYSNFCTTGGGVLFPPHCLHPDVDREDLFTKLCPRQDDIWFWTMAVLNGWKIMLPCNAYKLVNVEGSQEDALWEQNLLGGENDAALARMAEHYPQLLETLRREQRREWLPNMAKRVLRLPYRAARKLYRLLRQH